MKILITGGAGFIGSHLSDALLAAGHEITIIDDLSSGTKDFLPKEAEFLKMDIRDEKLTDIFKERHFDIIYHEAAQTMVPASIDNPYLDADINISGMLRVLEAARKTDVQKIIFSSSAAVYGDNPALPLTENLIPAPSSFYGLTKWMTEKYLALYHKIYELSYTVLRYSNVYGPRQGADGEGGVIYIFAKSLAENKPITIFGDGRQTRDFISVHDVVSANLAALHQADGEIINISTETELSLNDLAAEMIAASRRSRKLLHYGSHAQATSIALASLIKKRRHCCIGLLQETSKTVLPKRFISFRTDSK